MGKVRCLYFDKFNCEFFIKWAIIASYFILCAVELISFELWSQVTRIWNIENNILQKLVVGGNAITTNNGYEYAHVLRYLLILPIFEISKIIGVNYNYIFSLSIPFIIYFAAFFSTQSVVFISKTRVYLKENLVFCLIFSIFCFVSFFMNGRMVFAILASSILLYVSTGWSRLSPFTIMFCFVSAMFFSSISSGIFVICFLSFLLILGCKLSKGKIAENVVVVFFLLLFTIAIYPFLSDSLLKNIDFFGGGLNGLIGMFGHGFGGILKDAHGYIFWFYNMLVFLIIVVFMLGVCFFKNTKELFLLSMLIFVGGMFGYSILVMILPVVMVLFVSVLLIYSNSLFEVGDEK